MAPPRFAVFGREWNFIADFYRTHRVHGYTHRGKAQVLRELGVRGDFLPPAVHIGHENQRRLRCISPILRIEFRRLTAKYHRPDTTGALSDFPFLLIPDQAKTSDRRDQGRNRKLVTEQVDSYIRLGDIVKNPLPE